MLLKVPPESITVGDDPISHSGHVWFVSLHRQNRSWIACDYGAESRITYEVKVPFLGGTFRAHDDRDSDLLLCLVSIEKKLNCLLCTSRPCVSVSQSEMVFGDETIAQTVTFHQCLTNRPHFKWFARFRNGTFNWTWLPPIKRCVLNFNMIASRSEVLLPVKLLRLAGGVQRIYA